MPMPPKAVWLDNDQSQLQVWHAGRTYVIDMPKTASRRSAGGASAVGSNEIKAPMPGTVLQVKVSPGDAVTANQPLVIMESMKMEMTLNAPANAKVVAVNCKPGQLVEMNTILVKLE